MNPQLEKYHNLEAAGWEFSHNENGAIVMHIKGRTVESEWIIKEIEINKYGEVRDLPMDD